MFRFRCVGIDASVPISLTDEEAERLGMIIPHAYVEQNILQAGLVKSVFEYMLNNDVRDDTLLDSFLLYVDDKERKLMKKAISDSSLIKKHHHELWGILLDYGLNSSQNVSNFRTLFKEAAKNVFINKPVFIINKIQLGLGTFWGGIRIEEIDALLDTYKPNNENIMNCLEFDFDTIPGEHEGLSYFKKYLRNSTEEFLTLLLQFCTGSSTVDLCEKIKINFKHQDSRNQFMASKACFKILYLPKTENSSFKRILEETLKNQTY